MKHIKSFTIGLLIIFSAIAFVPVIAYPWEEKIDWSSFATAYNNEPNHYYVNTFADEVDIEIGDGLCSTASVKCSLRAAISEANLRDDFFGDVIINLPVGTFDLTLTELSASDYHISIDAPSQARIIIQGAGPDKTIIQGNRTSGLFEIYGNVEFRDLDFFNPWINTDVAGIISVPQNADVRLIRTVIIAAGYYGTIQLQGDNTRLTLEDTTIMGVTSRSDGGAIKNMGSKVWIKNSTIMSNNSEGRGGGIYSENGEVIIENSTINTNTAQLTGGGLYIKGGKLSVYNATIYGNHIQHNPDVGAAADLAGASSPQIILSNSILAEDTERPNPACAPETGSTVHISSAGYNIVGALGDCTIDQTATDIIGISSGVNPLNQNGGWTWTLSLGPASPAINGGNPAGCLDSNGQLLTTDQRGFPRPSAPFDTRCDIGAYEWGDWLTVYLPLITR